LGLYGLKNMIFPERASAYNRLASSIARAGISVPADSSII